MGAGFPSVPQEPTSKHAEPDSARRESPVLQTSCHSTTSSSGWRCNSMVHSRKLNGQLRQLDWSRSLSSRCSHICNKNWTCVHGVCVCVRERHTQRERGREREWEKKIKIIQLNSSFGPPEARQPLLQGTQCEGNWRLRHFQRRISPLDSKHCLWLQDFQRRISPLDSKHYFWLQDFLIFMSCHQILTDKVYSNQSHGVVTFFHARRKILPK